MELSEEVVTPSASSNILTLNFSAQLRLNYLQQQRDFGMPNTKS